MKKIFYILIFAVFIISCTSQNKNVKCLDGSGENSYFPSTNRTIIEKPLQMKTPPVIQSSRLAYTKIECGKTVAFFIKTSDGFEELPSKEIFDAFVNDFTKSCNGCLELYVSGCC